MGNTGRRADLAGDATAFAALVLRIAAHVADLSQADRDAGVTTALGELGAAVGADRAYTFVLDERDATLRNDHEWCAPGIAPQRDELQAVPLEAVAGWWPHFDADAPVVIPSVAALDSARAPRSGFSRRRPFAPCSRSRCAGMAARSASSASTPCAANVPGASRGARAAGGRAPRRRHAGTRRGRQRARRGGPPAGAARQPAAGCTLPVRTPPRRRASLRVHQPALRRAARHRSPCAGRGRPTGAATRPGGRSRGVRGGPAAFRPPPRTLGPRLPRPGRPRARAGDPRSRRALPAGGRHHRLPRRAARRQRTAGGAAVDRARRGVPPLAADADPRPARPRRGGRSLPQRARARRRPRARRRRG